MRSNYEFITEDIQARVVKEALAEIELSVLRLDIEIAKNGGDDTAKLSSGLSIGQAQLACRQQIDLVKNKFSYLLYPELDNRSFMS